MKFDTPATTNPIDAGRVVGQAVDRIDGARKTTGTATYAYEWHDVAPNPAYGYVVGAGIAKGRIRTMQLDAARRAPGVLAIVTAQNAGKLGKAKRNTARLLAGPEIQHYHQAIALVVAETFEQARAAAALIRVDYAAEKGQFDLEDACCFSAKPKKDSKPDTEVGDFEGAFAAAPVQLDARYTTPDQSHCMMEPHASMAAWSGDKVTIWTANQMVAWAHEDMATTLGIPKEKIRIVSPFIGGGFGGKLFLRAEVLLAVLGAREARRPVKVALTRPLMANNTTHRPATIQRIRIGATRDGKITAIGHESWSGDLQGGQPETAVMQTRLLYAGANRMTTMRLATLDLPEGNAMRAPGEAPGLMALEIAIDEMAEKLGMDPVQFRILNDTQVDPEKPERPFSQRRFVECLRLGAEHFGWNRRNPKPGSMREGQWLIGMGVASAFRNNLLTKSPITWLRADLGFRMRPAAQTASMRCTRTSAVARSTATSTKWPPNVDCWYFLSRSPYSMMSSADAPANCARGTLRPPARTWPPSNTACAAPMTMGVGAALMEALHVDKRVGFFANHDLASYEVPVHADIPHQEVIFLDETDPISSPMKAKGVGELGICGVAAAVANAVYHATGVRVRDYPVTLDKMLASMPVVG